MSRDGTEWRVEKLAADLAERGWRLIVAEPGGEVPGSSLAGKPETRTAHIRVERLEGGTMVYATSLAQLWLRIDAHEADRAARKVPAASAVPVQPGMRAA